jgi:hypothetical protein
MSKPVTHVTGPKRTIHRVFGSRRPATDVDFDEHQTSDVVTAEQANHEEA